MGYLKNNRKKILFMFMIILILATLFLSLPKVMPSNNSFDIKNDNKSLSVSPWGMNAHLTFTSSRDYANELCKSMADAGVSIIRIDIYWWYDKLFMQKDLCDRAVYYADKYGIEILLNFPQLPDRIDDEFLSEWTDMIRTYAIRYNGKNPIKIDGESKVRYPKVRYFEILNEVELNYKKQNISVSDTYKLIKVSSETLHNIQTENPVKLVFPGISTFNDFMKSLFNYEENGKKILDFVDILNIHSYQNTTENFVYVMNLWKDRRHKYNCIDKPFWITELGNSTWDVTDEEQASNLAKQYILASSYDVERTFYYQFHAFGGNYFNDRDQREEYFGIISNKDNVPYASFIKNDGKYNKALSEGDALKKVNLNVRKKNAVSVYTITEKMCSELKMNGLAIGGQNIIVENIEILKKNESSMLIWKGHKEVSNKSKDLLILPSKLFEIIKSGDRINISVKNKDFVYKWNGLCPHKSYYAYKHLSSLLNIGSTQPVVSKYKNGMVVASWRNIYSYVYAIWNDKSDSPVDLEKVNDIMRITSTEGKILKISKNVVFATRSPIYVESKKEIRHF